MDPLKMYFLLKTVIFQPAMLIYHRILIIHQPELIIGEINGIPSVSNLHLETHRTSTHLKRPGSPGEGARIHLSVMAEGDQDWRFGGFFHLEN